MSEPPPFDTPPDGDPGGGPSAQGAGGDAPQGGQPNRPPSGLPNPTAAVRGVGAVALSAEGLVLLLAIVPFRVLGAGGTGGTLLLVALAATSFVLAGLLRRAWAWIAGAV